MRKRLAIIVFLLLLFYFSVSHLNIFLFLITFSLVFFVVFLSHFIFKGAPYVRTSTSRIASMLDMACPTPDSCMVDLGSGMGDILLEFAKICEISHGIEINPFLIVISKLRLSKTGARVYRRNLWKFDLSRYDIVTVYGIPKIMQHLEYKLLNELKPGARVVSNKFPFPNWAHERFENGVYLYIKG